MLAWVRNTPACCCMVARMSLARVLGVLPLGGFSRLVQAFQRAVGGVGGQRLVVFVLVVELDDVASGGLPNTSRSSSELVPRRLAPCTAHAGAFAHGVGR